MFFIMACIVTGLIMKAAYDFFFPSNKSHCYICINNRCKSQNITVMRNNGSVIMRNNGSVIMRNNGSVIMLTCGDCNKKWRL